MVKLILLEKSYLVILVQLMILISSVIFQPTQAQEESLKSNQPSASSRTDLAKETTQNVSTTIRTQTSINQKVNSSLGEVLLSTNEFVDFTNDTPIILLDSISNSTQDASPTTSSPSIVTTISSLSDQVPTTQLTQNDTSTATSTFSNEVTTINPFVELKNQVDSSGLNSSSSVNTTSSEAVILEEEEDEDLNGLSEDVEETNSELNSSRGSRPNFDMPKNVSQYMDYIERLFHDLRHQITDLFEPHIPQLIRTSQMVELSGSCSYDMLRMALALRQFEPWALRMIDSSGKMPEGIFEGSFTALGSYDECLNTLFASSSSSSGQQQQQQQTVTQGKYCLVNVSPFLPPKPPADRVERLFQEEANRRNYTKDDQFSRLSPMFYYMKFRIGVCIPSSCIESDLDSISDALSTSLRLNITIPHCRVKQSQPITSHQLIGGLIFTSVLILVVGATIADCCFQKSDQMKRKRITLWRITNYRQVTDDEKVTISQKLSPAVAAHTNPSFVSGSLPLTLQGLPLKEQVAFEVDGATGATCATHKDTQTTRKLPFSERLEKHWTWLSFSLITSFKLYFTRKLPPPSDSQRNPSSPTMNSFHQKSHNLQQSQTKVYSNKQPPNQPSQQQTLIKCLDGIRVLSLCWVILANSYITLDPRATKRLTATREAPKDFLFQLVVQASLAIETFFFLSGILVSLSYSRNFQQQVKKGSTSLRWIQFYVHRYIRMTPATMLVIAFTMFAFRYGDGPLWFEATHKAHMSCSENWWRHLLHVANFIDTRQMCFIHYWYIAADMQLFLLAPLLMFLLYKSPKVAYSIVTLIGFISIGFVFYSTYIRNLPPTLLFYNTDPESRREYGNTIMTKPLTHALPYMVGISVGKLLSSYQSSSITQNAIDATKKPTSFIGYQNNKSLTTLFGISAIFVALTEVFLPYKWNNSNLPTRFLAAAYAALFRFFWSLALAYLVISCVHKKDKRCRAEERRLRLMANLSLSSTYDCSCYGAEEAYQAREKSQVASQKYWPSKYATQSTGVNTANSTLNCYKTIEEVSSICVCGSGGNLVNRLLGLSVFTHLSKLSFVAYLIHLPLMSVFVSQTRSLFAFSHTLVIHLALSYLVMTIVLSFVLVHIIEFPFITFEKYLFEKLFNSKSRSADTGSSTSGFADTGNHKQQQRKPLDNSNNHIHNNGITSSQQQLQTITSLPLEREELSNTITITKVNSTGRYKEEHLGESAVTSSAVRTHSSSGNFRISERL